MLHPHFHYTDSIHESFQAHLLDGRASAGASVDSARQNLAATFVNAFVNAGFGQVKGVQSMCRGSCILFWLLIICYFHFRIS